MKKVILTTLTFLLLTQVEALSVHNLASDSPQTIVDTTKKAIKVTKHTHKKVVKKNGGAGGDKTGNGVKSKGRS